jgi:hypothetical protein
VGKDVHHELKSKERGDANVQEEEDHLSHRALLWQELCLCLCVCASVCVYVPVVVCMCLCLCICASICVSVPLCVRALAYTIAY